VTGLLKLLYLNYWKVQVRLVFILYKFYTQNLCLFITINPGNSGGALVNSKGQLIGINSVKVVAHGFEGLGFAIPVNDAINITDSLIEFKYVRGRPFLGVRPDPSFNKEASVTSSIFIKYFIKKLYYCI